MNKRTSTCPFCRALEAEQDEPDIMHIRRRRVSSRSDDEWKPTQGIRVTPRCGVRHTRRTVYIYDYDDDEEEVVVDDDFITFPTVAQLYPTSFIPPPAPVDLECKEEAGVEESKDEDVQEVKKPEPVDFGPCKDCHCTTTRVSACCSCYWCWGCWFKALEKSGCNPWEDDKVLCPCCDAYVHINGKRVVSDDEPLVWI